jgi:hypothetical protein
MELENICKKMRNILYKPSLKMHVVGGDYKRIHRGRSGSEVGFTPQFFTVLC